jgi:hypothetical protein
MKVACPYCRDEIEAAASGLYTCPRCRAVFRVDFAEEPSPPAAAAGGGQPPEGARCARHPEREAVSTCPRCGKPVCPACAIDLPSGRACPDCAARETAAGAGGPAGTPWERRREIGWGRGLRDTIAGVLFHPTGFFAAMPPAGGLEGPLTFVLLLSVIRTIASTAPTLVATGVYGAVLLPPGAEGLPPEVQALLRGGFTLGAFQICCSPLEALIEAFVGAGLLHLALLVTGGARRGFEATLRVVCYAGAFGAVAVALLPLGLGAVAIGARMGANGAAAGVQAFDALLLFVFLLWALPVVAIGLRAVHGTTTAAAVGALVLLFVALGCCAGGGQLLQDFAARAAAGR